MEIASQGRKQILLSQMGSDEFREADERASYRMASPSVDIASHGASAATDSRIPRSPAEFDCRAVPMDSARIRNEGKWPSARFLAA